ncbi:MAG: hypothetical protein EBZ77_01225 [Chitinophagia bacterium]|nr:hypothetical protein [Chitinophagia bacterium]
MAIPRLFTITILLLLAFLPLCRLHAQERPENIRVVEEYNDGRGYAVRTIEYYQNGKRVRETIRKPVLPPVAERPINPDSVIHDSLYVEVIKSKYKVDVYYKRKRIRSYAAVFGPRPLENKCMEGDRCTPEGVFRIKMKNPNSHYHKFMLLDYPNDSSLVRFNELKKEGKLPPTARAGGNVGIHGIWKGGDELIDLGVGWTDGCVALKNNDIDELYRFLSVGTRVYIRK